jgi:glycosyltransferase involved in cell wall biosynthesis
MNPAPGPSSRPRVTVLLPVHNGARFLRASIDSVFEQTFRDFELLVIEDASTDETPSILASYGDERLRVLRNEGNLGLTPTLNRGLREARGEYIARQDADDLCDPRRLAVQVGYLDAHPPIALLGSGYRRIDEAGREIGIRKVPTDALSIRWRLLFLNAFPHNSIMLRSSILAEVGTYDESFPYGEDYELWSRIARTHEVAAINEPLVSCRRVRSSLTATYEEAAGSVAAAISAANIHRVLAAAPAGIEIETVDRDAAWRLLFGDYRGVEPGRARLVAPTILRLQHAFASALGLDASIARRHRLGVARVVASRLIRVGKRDRDPRAWLAAARNLASALRRG